MTGHNDFDFEPLPGLPAEPPKGETVLWQGRPDTMALALQSYGLGWIAAYFTGLMLWRASVGYGIGGITGAFAYGIPYIGVGLLGCFVVWILAYAQARATVYTVTTARVAMRIGAALSVTFNLPFTQIGSADLSPGPRGTGTIALQTLGDVRLAYLIVWPHVRPWAFARTQPALRCIPDAARVAKLLAEAASTRLSVPATGRMDGMTATTILAAE
jgi:Bacterial PH domain